MSSPIIAGTLTSFCVDGGDAPELQTRVREAIAVAAASGLYVVDCTLSGVGTGPRWLAQLTFTTANWDRNAPQSGATLATCVQGGDPAEVNLRIQTVLSIPFRDYIALEMAGAGAGRDYMALILQTTLNP